MVDRETEILQLEEKAIHGLKEEDTGGALKTRGFWWGRHGLSNHKQKGEKLKCDRGDMMIALHSGECDCEDFQEKKKDGDSAFMPPEIKVWGAWNLM